MQEPGANSYMFQYCFLLDLADRLPRLPQDIMIDDACSSQEKQGNKDWRHMLTILEDCLDNIN